MASAVVKKGGVVVELSSESSAGSRRLSWVRMVSSVGGVRERESRERGGNKQQQEQEESGKKVGVALKKGGDSSPTDGGGCWSDNVGGGSSSSEFEFRLGDGVDGGMVWADELFADGMVVPLHVATRRGARAVVNGAEKVVDGERAGYVGVVDPSVLISPLGPKWSSRWKEVLGLKKAAKLEEAAEAARWVGSGNQAVDVGVNCNGHNNKKLRSVRHFLQRKQQTNKELSSGGTDCGSLTFPLMVVGGDAESSSLSCWSSDCTSIGGRLSLSSSSSSGADHEEVGRLSLDWERQAPRVWVSHKSRVTASTEALVGMQRVGRSPGGRGVGGPPPRCASVDSPRMNSSGKVVFQNLGRSSSSPSSIGGGGGRNKGGRGGVERSYSTNVRVLNVPVCSLKSGTVFGLGLFSGQKKAATTTDGGGGSRSSSRGGGGVGGGGHRML